MQSVYGSKNNPVSRESPEVSRVRPGAPYRTSTSRKKVGGRRVSVLTPREIESKGVQGERKREGWPRRSFLRAFHVRCGEVANHHLATFTTLDSPRLRSFGFKPEKTPGILSIASCLPLFVPSPPPTTRSSRATAYGAFRWNRSNRGWYSWMPTYAKQCGCLLPSSLFIRRRRTNEPVITGTVWEGNFLRPFVRPRLVCRRGSGSLFVANAYYQARRPRATQDFIREYTRTRIVSLEACWAWLSA